MCNSKVRIPREKSAGYVLGNYLLCGGNISLGGSVSKIISLLKTNLFFRYCFTLIKLDNLYVKQKVNVLMCLPEI